MNKFADNPIMTPADTTLIVDAVAAKPFLDFYDLIVRKVVYGHVLSIFWLPLTAELSGVGPKSAAWRAAWGVRTLQ
jgi:hypothetical protein